MVILKANNLQWILGREDDSDDLCAHGLIEFRIGEHAFVSPDDGILSISAAAFFLLRTLSSDHTKNNPVAEYSQLFPEDGYCVWPGDGRYDVMILGTPHGIDLEIRHEGDSVVISAEDGTQFKVLKRDWMNAVFSFADQVKGFYESCSPKNTPSDDLYRRGWSTFWEEWDRNRNTDYGN